MLWLKEWDKCVFRRANPVKKRRFDDQESLPVSIILKIMLNGTCDEDY